MKVLGVETSCDETSVAIVEDGHNIITNVVATQIPFHKQYQGVVPEIASRKHAELILPVAKKALADSKLDLEDIDAIAATNRPGLMGALLVGFTFAKALAWTRKLPFIAINHMMGHLYAAHLTQDLSYPYLGLLVSGGHTIICKVEGFDNMQVLGTTIDDSIGEAFDKVAKFYGLGYPGGVIVQKTAEAGNSKAFSFPISHIEGAEHKYDLSFSGLKTSVIHQRHLFLQSGYEDNLANICASFQEVACRAIERVLAKAVKDTGLYKIVAGGGVAANTRLRAMLAEHKDWQCNFPPLKYCGDNAAMIAGVAYNYLLRGDTSTLDTACFPRIEQFKRHPTHN